MPSHPAPSRITAASSGRGTVRAAAAYLRITVALVGRAAADLRRITERTQMSQTDVVNRAVSLYEFVDSEISSGAELIVRRDGRDQLVRLLLPAPPGGREASRATRRKSAGRRRTR